MKYYFFCPFILAVFLAVTINAQNLVPNPSFEEYIDCPYSTADFQNQVVDWYSFSGSPDYFNTCSNDLDGFAGVPSNAWGYQYPVSGNAYCAVVPYLHYAENYREYIACPITPLIVGEQYYVMFYISQCDGGELADWRCATNHFGLKFFKDPTYNPDSNPYNPQNTADIGYDQMFTDTTNWRLVEGWFTADQAYNWIALGNFYDDAHTDTLQLGNPANEFNECTAIYYMDNVCISTNPADCQYLLSTHQNEALLKINIYPNPAVAEFEIHSYEHHMKSIEVFDATGKRIYEENLIDQNKLNINCNLWASGIYLLRMRLDDNLIYQTKIMKK